MWRAVAARFLEAEHVCPFPQVSDPSGLCSGGSWWLRGAGLGGPECLSCSERSQEAAGVHVSGCVF